MENYFLDFKKKTIGDLYLPQKNNKGIKLIYADWAASGRMYIDIENKLLSQYAPLYSNTHSAGTYIGEFINNEYLKAKQIIKNHFKADDDYAVISTGHGMTSAMNKLQDIILEHNEKDNISPIVFVTPFEHNSNYITWIEKKVECIILDFDENGEVDLKSYYKLLEKNKDRLIIGSFSACSNVTGIRINLDVLIEKVKEYKGITCVDYTTIAPYDSIDLSNKNIDALVFSSHKLLGGVGGPGILIIKKSLYKRKKPTMVGGGVVKWVNSWGDIVYVDNIEQLEEAGTPPIIQTIRTSLAIQLKEQMGVENILEREKEINKILFFNLSGIDNLQIYDVNLQNRLSIISFNINNVEYTKIVKELSENYGIQGRGGCCCSPIYGHKLLKIEKKVSKYISRNIDKKVNIGWIRISLNPIVSNKEVSFICNAIRKIACKYRNI